ncbi:aminodeoxychorismate synthase component I [Halpernia frigidisoli]|uniref:Para-aminobenzoate synthetase component 1 n=1 Tax=Halpernia frigidisoli TaxID=1125876 RepID=A0A1I3GI46_9FLAO|nr:aminodeoxychorismate synthase component I [Halpernia frigidisoli]SFI23185.1 para-aminobenzoate synthetase component 1 [Halpernia frigidisoli]
MFSKIKDKFTEIDVLSQNGKAFFFFIDFKIENILIYNEDELLKENIAVYFPDFKNKKPHKSEKILSLKSFPPTKSDYEVGFKKVQDNLKLGNSYLVNYTCETPIESNFTLNEFFDLADEKYKVCKDDDFVFFSPETFIEIKDDKIFTHPMKGTIDASRENAVGTLKNDVKEKAEHYTVVDLLRNDLSMVADQVKVDEFQRIDFIKTKQKNLYAMSSEISGNLKPEFKNKIGSILKTLLPAGSILGAPKKKTLDIILDAETHERNFYTGVCGYFDGKNLDSCVMIRFIEKKDNKLYFKSGGGITHLSLLNDEYQEMKNKIYVPIH